MRDWAGYFWGDCFDLVKQIHGVGYNKALAIIAMDFNLIKVNGHEVIERIPMPRVKITPREVSIRVKRRAWNSQDKAFWQRWDIRRKTLEYFNIAPVERAWLNDKPYYWYSSPEKVAYAYHFGGYDYKLYFPYVKKGDGRPRFLHTKGSILQGFLQLPDEADILVVTKSMKDVVKLYEMGVVSVAPMSEGQFVEGELFENLRKRFNTIIAFYDNDMAGLRRLVKIRNEFPSVIPLHFPRNHPKDFTDYYEKYGYDDTQLLIDQVKSEIL